MERALICKTPPFAVAEQTTQVRRSAAAARRGRRPESSQTPAMSPAVGTIPLPTHFLIPPQKTPSSEPLSRHLPPFHYHRLSISKRIVPSLETHHHLSLCRLLVSSLGGLIEHDSDHIPESGSPEFSPSVLAMAPVMKRGYGAFGGGATLEKSKLDLSQSTTRVSPKTEDGGGGGDIGNKINFGGGDGGDDGGDDDDYFGDADDDDEGDDDGFFRRRIALPEVFDRKIVEAILQEWYRSVTDLPAGLRQAVELGFISSAQMVRYITNFARPTIARILSRSFAPSVSRAFVGRMIADPAFLYKMYWEQLVTVANGVWWEFKNRKERLKDEWGLAALNILSLSLCNAAIVWSLAPCRSYGSTFQFSFQNAIQKLPNNVFERNYAFREFDSIQRIQSLFYKAGELCSIGLITGAVCGSLMNILASSRKDSSSVSVPTTKISALSYGAFLGLSGNLRYQLLYGAERVMQQQFNNVNAVVFFCTALRSLNIYIGDATRVASLGLDVAPAQSESSQPAYQRSTATASRKSSNSWSDLTSKIPFGLFPGGNTSSRPRKTRRKLKRVVVAN